MAEKESLAIGKGAPGPGRKKGVPNKMTAQVKEMILEALEGAGGVEYLIQCAQDQKTAGAFLTLVGKVLPLQVTGDPDSPLTINWPVPASRVER